MGFDLAAQLEALEGAPFGVALFDRDLRCVRVNAAFAASRGGGVRPLVGRSVLEVLPHRGPDTAEQCRRVLARGAATELEVEDCGGGLRRRWRLSLFPIRDREAVRGVGASMVEVAGDHQAAAATRSELFMAAVLDTTANVIVVLDREGRIVRLNKACEEITGYSAAELLGRSVFEVLIPDADLPGVRETFRHLREGDFPNKHQNRWRMKDGTERVFEWANTCLAGEQGSVDLVIATGTDVTERHAGEEALRQSEKRLLLALEEARSKGAQLEAILGCIADAIVVYDRGGRIMKTNRAADVLLECHASLRQQPLAERLANGGKQWLAEDGHALRPEETAPFRSMRSGEAVKGSILRMRARDEERWFNVSAAPLQVAGLSTGAVVSMSDITDRRHAEEATREAERRLRSVVRELPSGLILADLSTRELEWNEEALRIHGYTQDGEVHRFLESLISDHELRTLQREPLPVERWPLPRLLNGESFRDYEILVRNVRLGWERVFSYSGVVLPTEPGAHPRGLLAIQDVTARKAAEDALRKSEEGARAQAAQLEAILNAVGDGVIVYDTAGRTIRSTPAADALLGLTAARRQAPVQDRVMQQYHVWTEQGRLVARDEMPSVRAALHAQTFRDAVLRVQNAGTDRWLRMNAVPYSLDSRHMGAVLSMTDVTDRKRAEQQLREVNDELREVNERLVEADQRKDEFLGMLSHELRNPLAPIRNSLYILDHAEPSGLQARRAREIAARQILHLTRLVDDLLDVTRIARGKVSLHRQALDLVELARQAAEDNRAMIADRGLELALELPRAVLTVHGDPTRLGQILGNLLHNAAKFTPRDGRVSLTVGCEGSRAVVRVRDTGAGIEPSLLAQVFEPFVQAKQTLARSEGGLGLGLALVKGLVGLHGGEVTAVSEGPGQGTEFTVALPLLEHPAASRATGLAGPGAAQGGRRVLVVDDNRDAAESLAELVTLLGHRVDVAYDGLAAVERVRCDAPDVVLCDIGLPGLDGYEVARSVRSSQQRPIRLIAVSGYAQPEDVARAAASGFDGHIAKPPDPDQVARALQ